MQAILGSSQSVRAEQLLNRHGANRESLLMPEHGSNPGNSNIVAVNLSKIGAVESKGDIVSVYNLHLQSYIVVFLTAEPDRPQKYIVTIGNLNPSGI